MWATLLCLVVVATLTGVSLNIWKAIILTQATQGVTNIIPGDISSPEEYAVYTAVIEAEFIDSSIELIVIENQAGFEDIFGPRLEPEDFKLGSETWIDYLTKNETISSLGTQFPLSQRYLLIEPSDLEDRNMEFALANIHQTAFLHFSRVGFNSNRDEAVVHVTATHLGRSKPAPMFAYGVLYLLRKIDGIWIIQGQSETFIT